MHHSDQEFKSEDVAKNDTGARSVSDNSPDAVSMSMGFSRFENYEEDWSSSIFLEGSSFLCDKEAGAENMRKTYKNMLHRIGESAKLLSDNRSFLRDFRRNAVVHKKHFDRDHLRLVFLPEHEKEATVACGDSSYHPRVSAADRKNRGKGPESFLSECVCCRHCPVCQFILFGVKLKYEKRKNSGRPKSTPSVENPTVPRLLKHKNHRIPSFKRRSDGGKKVAHTKDRQISGGLIFEDKTFNGQMSTFPVDTKSGNKPNDYVHDNDALSKEESQTLGTSMAPALLTLDREKAHGNELLHNISENKSGISIVVTRNLLPLVARKKSGQSDQGYILTETPLAEKSLVKHLSSPIKVIEKTVDVSNANAAIVDLVPSTNVLLPSQIPSYNGERFCTEKPPRPPRRSDSWTNKKPLSEETRSTDFAAKHIETRLTSPSCSQRLPRLKENSPSSMRRNLTFTTKQASSVSCSLSNSCADFLEMENDSNRQIEKKFSDSTKAPSDFNLTDLLSPVRKDRQRFSTPKTAIPVLRAHRRFCIDLNARMSALHLSETTDGEKTSAQNFPKIHVKTTKAVVLRDQAIKKKHFSLDV